MSKNTKGNILNESTIRRFMKLANIEPLTESYFDAFNEEEDEEMAPAEEPAMDDMGGEAEMEMDAEEPAAEGGAAAAVPQEAVEEIVAAIASAVEEVTGTPVSSEPAEEPAMDDVGADAEEPAAEEEPDVMSEQVDFAEWCRSQGLPDPTTDNSGQRFTTVDAATAETLSLPEGVTWSVEKNQDGSYNVYEGLSEVAESAHEEEEEDAPAKRYESAGEDDEEDAPAKRYESAGEDDEEETQEEQLIRRVAQRVAERLVRRQKRTIKNLAKSN